MLRTLMEIASTYNRSMYKNRHFKRTNNKKKNIFLYQKLLYKKASTGHLKN